MRRETRIVRLSLVTSPKENKNLVNDNPMLNPHEDVLRTVVTGDSSNVWPEGR